METKCLSNTEKLYRIGFWSLFKLGLGQRRIVESHYVIVKRSLVSFSAFLCTCGNRSPKCKQGEDIMKRNLITQQEII